MSTRPAQESSGASEVPARLASRQAAIATARRLAEAIRTRRAKADQDRQVPRETIDELIASGLFGIVTPREYGGSDLGFATLFDVVVELSSACPSTGWVYGVIAGHSWLVNLFPLKAQGEVLGDPTALTATLFRLAGTVTREPGGYRLVGGEGRFASAIDFASWIVVGNAIQHPDGRREPCFFIIPRNIVTIIDDWHTVGMRGTGSKSLRVADTFIPEHRAVLLSDMLNGTSPGAMAHSRGLYRLPFAVVAPFSIVGAPIGSALGALGIFARDATARLRDADDVALADAGFILSRLAEASADVDAAIALVRASAERIDTVADPAELSALERSSIPRNWAYAAQTAREAVNKLFAVAGGSQIYDHSELQQFWRDANAGAQHFAFGWENAMKGHGRALVGKAPQPVQFKRG